MFIGKSWISMQRKETESSDFGFLFLLELFLKQVFKNVKKHFSE